MRCDFEQSGAGEARCRSCGRRIKSPHMKVMAVCRAPTRSLPGPGTQLKRLLAELGLKPKKECACNAKVRKMDRWGVDGCRTNFDTIRGWLVEANAQATWGEKITAAAVIATSGLRRQVDLTDVEGSLLRIAIERCVQRETTAKLEQPSRNERGR